MATPDVAAEISVFKPPMPIRALIILALAAFVVGTAELMIVGILNLIAHDTGSTVSAAGVLVTFYALGISFGAPIITALTIKWNRRLLLVGALVLYAAGNILAAVAASFDMLLVARIVTGMLHGLILGLTFSIGVRLVPPARAGQAISLVFGGMSIATILGVPMGVLVGQLLGWRAAFGGIVGLGLLMAILVFRLVPPVKAPVGRAFGRQARAAFAPRVLGMLGVGLLLMGGQFTIFTYLEQLLRISTHITGGRISLFLLLYGLACAAGTFVGGKYADRSATTVLVGANVVLIGVFTALYMLSANLYLLAIILVVWGFAGFGLVPSFQLRVLQLAGEGSDLAATLGASAINAGIALGSLVGGWVLAAHDVRAVIIAAGIMCALGLPATIATHWLKPSVER